MINDLLNFGIANNYFMIQRIGNFDNAPLEGYSHVNRQAIEFDKTQKEISRILGLQCLKSCDALDIIVVKPVINFIEFKQIISNSQIQKWISDDMDLPQKIKDSREILLSILRNSRFNQHKDRINRFNQINKNFIIAFDLINDHKQKILIYSKWLQIQALIQKELQNNYIQGENFNAPVCVMMANFDTDYLPYT